MFWWELSKHVHSTNVWTKWTLTDKESQLWWSESVWVQLAKFTHGCRRRVSAGAREQLWLQQFSRVQSSRVDRHVLFLIRTWSAFSRSSCPNSFGLVQVYSSLSTSWPQLHYLQQYVLLETESAFVADCRLLISRYQTPDLLILDLTHHLNYWQGIHFVVIWNQQMQQWKPVIDKYTLTFQFLSTRNGCVTGCDH